MTDDAEYLRLLHAVNAARRALDALRRVGGVAADPDAIYEAGVGVRLAEEALAWWQHQHAEDE